MSVTKKLFRISPDVRGIVNDGAPFANVLFGVEVEMENAADVARQEFKYWRVEGDGSLRNNGHELVLIQPLGGADLVAAIDELHTKVAACRVQPDMSDRTSVHVHIDARNMEQTQLATFLMLYVIFEKQLFRIGGENRWGNIFCFPVSYAQQLVSLMGALTSGSERAFADDLHRMAGNVQRYAALNMVSMLQYGSIEIRIHEGTWDKRELTEWLLILSRLYTASLTIESLPSLHRNISAHGPVEYVRQIFGDLSHRFMHDQLAVEVMEGVRLSQDIAYWAELNNAKPTCKRGDTGNLFSQFLEKHQKQPKTASVKIRPEDMDLPVPPPEGFDVYDYPPNLVARILGISEEDAGIRLIRPRDGGVGFSVTQQRALQSYGRRNPMTIARYIRNAHIERIRLRLEEQGVLPGDRVRVELDNANLVLGDGGVQVRGAPGPRPRPRRNPEND